MGRGDESGHKTQSKPGASDEDFSEDFPGDGAATGLRAADSHQPCRHRSSPCPRPAARTRRPAREEPLHLPGSCPDLENILRRTVGAFPVSPTPPRPRAEAFSAVPVPTSCPGPDAGPCTLTAPRDTRGWPCRLCSGRSTGPTAGPTGAGAGRQGERKSSIHTAAQRMKTGSRTKPDSSTPGHRLRGSSH